MTTHASSPSLSRRRFLEQSLGGMVGLRLAGLAPLSGVPVLASAASPTAAGSTVRAASTWGLNTNIDFCGQYSDSAAEAVARVGALVEETGCSIVREGLTGGFDSPGSLGGSAWLEPLIAWLDKRGMKLIVQMHLTSVKNPDKAYGPEWEAGVTHRCTNVARYFNETPSHRRVLGWFLLINEPDMAGVVSKGLSPERLVRYHELAWKAIKSVNPDFLIEGFSLADGAGSGASKQLTAINRGTRIDPNAKAQTKAPGGMNSRDIFMLGGARWCDIVGFHNYNKADENNPFGARALVRNMQEAHDKHGFPVRPIVDSETGCHLHLLNIIGANSGGLKPLDAPSEQKWAAVAHWHYLNVLYHARWGVSRSFLYSLGASGASWMNLVDYPMRKRDRNGTPPANVPPYTKRPSFAPCVAAMKPMGLESLNGSFEKPEDKYSNWIVGFDPLDYKSPDFEYREWKEAHFLRDGKQTAPRSKDPGYLRLDPGLPKQVRRRVEGLTEGRSYRVSAWVRQEAAAAATLAVYGFDQNQPALSVSTSARESGKWSQLSAVFTPRRSIVGVDSWGVISLEHDGGATCFWDEVTFTPA